MAEGSNFNLNRDEDDTAVIDDALIYHPGKALSEEEATPKPEELGFTLDKITRSLDILRNKYAEKQMETIVSKKIIDNKKVADVLNTVLTETDDNELCSMKQRNNILKLLEDNDRLGKLALRISKENLHLEFTIIKEKFALIDAVEERNKVMKEASKVLSIANLNFSESNQSNSSEMVEDSYDVEKDLKSTAAGVLAKLHRIKLLARILYNLITHSEEPWVMDKDLFEVVCCTGKLQDKDFGKKDLRDLKDLVDDVMHKLNQVNLNG